MYVRVCTGVYRWTFFFRFVVGSHVGHLQVRCDIKSHCSQLGTVAATKHTDYSHREILQAIPHYTALHWIVPYHAVPHCIALYCTVPHCIVLYHTELTYCILYSLNVPHIDVYNGFNPEMVRDFSRKCLGLDAMCWRGLLRRRLQVGLMVNSLHGGKK